MTRIVKLISLSNLGISFRNSSHKDHRGKMSHPTHYGTVSVGRLTSRTRDLPESPTDWVMTGSPVRCHYLCKTRHDRSNHRWSVYTRKLVNCIPNTLTS